MNDEQAEIQKARVMALHEKWVGPLGLAWWHWDMRWYRGAIPSAPESLFYITIRFEYLDVALSMNLAEVSECSDEDLERAFVHECGHLFTVPLKNAADKRVDGDAMHMLEEHQASLIGKAFLWLRAHCEQEQISAE